MTLEIKIEHELAGSRFVAKLEDEEAELNYSKEGNTLNFLGVFVPETFLARYPRYQSLIHKI